MVPVMVTRRVSLGIDVEGCLDWEEGSAVAEVASTSGATALAALPSWPTRCFEWTVSSETLFGTTLPFLLVSGGGLARVLVGSLRALVGASAVVGTCD